MAPYQCWPRRAKLHVEKLLSLDGLAFSADFSRRRTTSFQQATRQATEERIGWSRWLWLWALFFPSPLPSRHCRVSLTGPRCGALGAKRWGQQQPLGRLRHGPATSDQSCGPGCFFFLGHHGEFERGSVGDGCREQGSKGAEKSMTTPLPPHCEREVISGSTFRFFPGSSRSVDASAVVEMCPVCRA